jgi:hypothetical protein
MRIAATRSDRVPRRPHIRTRGLNPEELSMASGYPQQPSPAEGLRITRVLMDARDLVERLGSGPGLAVPNRIAGVSSGVPLVPIGSS